jgi:hypothetical protein
VDVNIFLLPLLGGYIFIKLIIREDNDGIEQILLKALEEAKFVSITLKSEQVYV